MDKQENPSRPICPKCKGNMETGRLVAPRLMFFLSDAERGKLVGKVRRVGAYRCQNCGYCEMYSQGPLLGVFDSFWG